MIFDRINFHLLRFISLHHLPVDRKYEKSVFLTFDDGPCPGITEFVLDELKRYGFKATFFCVGKNAENYPLLIKRIREEGHAIGNHSYSHLNGLKCDSQSYYNDVRHGAAVLHTYLFRPPWGALRPSMYCKLRKAGYQIHYWSTVSHDTDLEDFNLPAAMDSLSANTVPGSVVLFHFCEKHAKDTMAILPKYLSFLFENGYSCPILH